ncbi:MAG: low specificity L-threonine aldolase, partial [Synergistaceae bacterium]|nr:low specificity L-threonine aldolase [Synergistaceae bacterium]
GGTKCGALFGEAVVIPDINKLKIKNFKTLIKQQGGLLAKGRLLGLQFEELFKDNLYFDLARHADNQAMRIKSAFEAQGVKLFYDSFTNQQFPVLNKSQFEILNKDFKFELWQVIDENSSAYRFCTSWATKSEAVDALINAIKNI